nr:6-bladed beta-propeller [uncultured Carboxylicivirga sp.]
MIKYVVVIISFILFLGCTNLPSKKTRYSQPQIDSLHIDSVAVLNTEIDSIIKINLNPFLKKQSFSFGQNIKEIKLIPLETSKECLLDEIRKIIITDSCIYVHDDFKGGGVVIFDINGRFIRRIPHGNGPGELNRMYDMDFDEEKQELVIYEHSFFVFYNSTGHYKRQQRLAFDFHNFIVTRNGYMFKINNEQDNNHLGKFCDFRMVLTNKDLRLISIGLPSKKTDVNLENKSYLYKNNDSIYITQKFIDTIYTYDSDFNQLKARYLLDYSNKKMPFANTVGKWKNFNENAKENDYYFFLGRYIDVKNHQVFFLHNWHVGATTVIYRDKESGNLIGGTQANYDINEIPPIAFPISFDRDYFISWYLPSNNDLFATKSTIISKSDKEKIKDLTVEDNPVVVLFKLKKF